MRAFGIGFELIFVESAPLCESLVVCGEMGVRTFSSGWEKEGGMGSTSDSFRILNPNFNDSCRYGAEGQ